MLSPHLGLGLEARITGLGLGTAGLGLVSIMASASFHLASKPRFIFIFALKLVHSLLNDI